MRHEFLAGQIFAMAGGTREHGARSAAVIAALSAELRGKPCRVYTSDVRIRVAATGLDTYPDVSVVCGHAEHDTEDKNALTNPTLLVEVLSPSTEEYDRGEKLEHYQRLDSLQEAVFISHSTEAIEVCRRTDSDSAGSGWISSSAGPGETVELRSLGSTLVVDEIFDDPLA